MKELSSDESAAKALGIQFSKLKKESILRGARSADLAPENGFVFVAVIMARDKRLAELARSLHRASERLWLRVADPRNYQIAEADLKKLQKTNTELNRAITKLKLKSNK